MFFSVFKCLHCESPLQTPEPLCLECRLLLVANEHPSRERQNAGETLGGPLFICGAFGGIEPQYSILRTWKKNASQLWWKYFEQAFRRMVREDQAFQQAAFICPIPRAPKRVPTGQIAPASWVALYLQKAISLEWGVQPPIIPYLKIEPQRGWARQAQRSQFERRYSGLRAPWFVPPSFQETLRFQSGLLGIIADDFITTGRTVQTALAELYDFMPQDSKLAVVGISLRPNQRIKGSVPERRPLESSPPFGEQSALTL